MAKGRSGRCPQVTSRHVTSLQDTPHLNPAFSRPSPQSPATPSTQGTQSQTSSPTPPCRAPPVPESGNRPPVAPARKVSAESLRKRAVVHRREDSANTPEWLRKSSPRAVDRRRNRSSGSIPRQDRIWPAHPYRG